MPLFNASCVSPNIVMLISPMSTYISGFLSDAVTVYRPHSTVSLAFLMRNNITCALGSKISLSVTVAHAYSATTTVVNFNVLSEIEWWHRCRNSDWVLLRRFHVRSSRSHITPDLPVAFAAPTNHQPIGYFASSTGVSPVVSISDSAVSTSSTHHHIIGHAYQGCTGI